jgi:ATP-dependent DNA ligase
MRLSKKEGVIVKWLDAPYGEKKHWCKIKFEWTADTVVMGFDPPEEWSTKSDGTISRTEFFLNGWIGAIRCGQYVNGVLTECASVSGFPKDLREAMSRLPKFYVGKVLRIKHYGKEPTGRFRHPQFGDFRTDKDPKDCIQDLNEI